MLRKYGLKRIVNECRFSRTRNARHAKQCAQGEVNIHALQVISATAFKTQEFSISRATHFGNVNSEFSIQVTRRQGVRAEHFFGRTLENNFSAQASCPRTHIDDIIRRAHHIFIVFYDYYRVARVAQTFQRSNQAHVVALMQSDGGFVQNVEHVDELRTNLSGEANALTFAARQGHGGA